jgi:serine-type D-Ala-D-Ala carboxypeptidase/endopeptidase (penicillin-binding protein 4)
LSISDESILAAGLPGRAAVTLRAVLDRGRIQRALVVLVLAICGTFPIAAHGAPLPSSLGRQMRIAGPYAGAYVVDATAGQTLFAWKAGTSRILASNTKLFTTSAVLDRLGPDATLTTEILTATPPNPEGVITGDVWLRGGGDPAFGSSTFVHRWFGPNAASVQDLAGALAGAGVTAIRGGVRGDESFFDTIRGIHDSRYGVSPYVGPLSALTFNHGLATHGFQPNPPSYAAAQLRKALDADGITPGHAAAPDAAPAGAVVLASVPSPPMATLVQLTNKESDNFFAEMLLKDLGRLVYGTGSTAVGARAAVAHAAALGSRVRMIDGSGLDHGDRASPRDVVRLLLGERRSAAFPAFYASLPVAGVDGTLDKRMRRGPAHRNCHAKTGSLIAVSTLSGYCTARNGHALAFSFLMNGLSVSYARRLQDRMTTALAAWAG